MKQRERILELVKKGVLTTEEALVLLENLEISEAEKAVEDTVVDSEKNDNSFNFEEMFKSDLDDIADELDGISDKMDEDEARLEDILASLSKEATNYANKITEIEKEIKDYKTEIREIKEQISMLNTLEEFDQENEENDQNRKELTERLTEIEGKKSLLEDQLVEVERALQATKDKQKNTRKEFIGVKFDIPNDWKEQAEDSIQSATEKVTEAGTQVGDILKKTFSQIGEVINENLEWKDLNMKVPGVSTRKFTKTFNFVNVDASIINVKIANGNIKFRTWDENAVKIEAEIKLYGKMNEDTVEESFAKRSNIEVDDDIISFNVPNKRVKCDAVFYLPKRTYDHVSVKMLNGNVNFTDFDCKDLYTKTTNGDIVFSNVNGVMVEIVGVNGNIEVKDGKIKDLVGESVNSDIRIQSDVVNTNMSLVNGDIKYTAIADSLKKIDCNSVNGNVKIALPTNIVLDCEAKTNIGSVKNRIEDVEIIKERSEKGSQYLNFIKHGESENYVTVKASTVTGNVFLKEVE